MQKNYKKIWCSLIVISLITSFIIPLHLGAEDQSSTYLTIPVGCTLFTKRPGYSDMYLCTDTANNRLVISKYNNSTMYLGFFTPEEGKHFQTKQSTGIPTWDDNNLIRGTNTYNGITYYGGSYGTDNYYRTFQGDFRFTAPDGVTSANNLFKYAYGEYAIGPEPPAPVYGELIDLGFYTNFTNTQQSSWYQMRYNKDNIQWNGYEDSLGNQINTLDMQVEIQAYATEYSASSKIDLLNKTILDLVNYGSPQTIYEGSANIGEKSFTWGEVADALNGSSTTIEWWSNLAPHSYESMWYANGWLYRIRLKSADDSFIGNWQIIYGVTSAPPEDSETIYNYYYYYGGQGISDDVVDVLNNINTTNNTQNIWYINNNPVDPSSGSNWLETLLKFIADMIGRILDLFGSMFDSVLDFLLGLFEGFDPVGSFIDWWNQLKIKFNSIDLTLPWFNLPEDEDLSSFGVLVQKTIEIYTLNDLGFMIYIPLLLLILKVVFL